MYRRMHRTRPGHCPDHRPWHRRLVNPHPPSARIPVSGPPEPRGRARCVSRFEIPPRTPCLTRSAAPLSSAFRECRASGPSVSGWFFDNRRKRSVKRAPVDVRGDLKGQDGQRVRPWRRLHGMCNRAEGRGRTREDKIERAYGECLGVRRR